MTGGATRGRRRGIARPRSLAPFRHRAYARLWSGAFVSNIGTWMETVAIGVYVTEVTGQAAWTGTVAAAGFVPVALLAPIGGALADRLPRRRLLISTSLVQAGLAALLTALFVTGEPSAPVVTLIVFGGGVASALGFPAYQAMLPDLVPEEDLPGAMALSSAQWNLGRVIGPALAGLVVELGGFSWALGLNAASFLAVVFVLLPMRLPTPAPGPGESLRSSMLAGIRFARTDPGLRVSFGAMALNTLVAAPFIALVPAMAEKVFDAGARGTSILVTAQGVGAVAMGLALGGLTQRYGARRVVVAMLALLPPALVTYAWAPGLASSAAALLVVGALYLGALSSFFTISQLRAPPALRGRVLAVNNVILGSLYPLGSVVQGAIADTAGLRATTAGAGIVMAAVLLAVRVLRPGITRAIEQAPAPAG
ncbi:MAG: MFS transporter [Acidimicrobiia bacterium]|nr:MAG: MFS transporter [Acidimicrobiia bacterium]